MRSLFGSGRPQREDQSPRVYSVYRPPARRRASTPMVVVARIVLAAVVLTLLAGLMVQI
jgi:hypothetical protein